ncbi:MAG: hypothetical protein ACREPB_01350 [Arenimonas sp.]
MKKFLLLLLALVLMQVVTPAEAASKRSKSKQLEVSMFKYASAIRWSEFELALSYIEPAYREKNPLSDLDVERYKQIQITGYTSKSQDYLPDGGVEQAIEIRLINRNTLAERIITDVQVWRWDEKAKRWWLTTGLPDITPKRF